MAISVDRVYRVVLAILNKEQRGYLTPDQFNRLGQQAQLDLLKKSFYDYNRSLTRSNVQGVNSEYGDIASNIEEKLDALTSTAWLDFNSGKASLTNKGDNNNDPIYKIISISTNGTTGRGRISQVEKVKKSDYLYLSQSSLTAPTEKYPIYYQEGDNIVVYPATIQEADIDYIKTPESPKWDYTGGGATAYVFNPVGNEETPSDSVDFSLHPSEETDLVIRILELAGVVVKDPTVIQVAQQKETINFNQENA
jgi:hypothetical protein